LTTTAAATSGNLQPVPAHRLYTVQMEIMIEAESPEHLSELMDDLTAAQLVERAATATVTSHRKTDG